MVETTWLVSSGGRRGALVNLLRGKDSRVVVCDASQWSAAGVLADHFEIVPKISSPAFIDSILSIAKCHGVQYIVPTIDTELRAYASNRDLFERNGMEVLVSSEQVAELSWDKWKFHQWLLEHDLPSITTFEYSELSRCNLEGPVIAKPRTGSSSVGVISSNQIELLPEELMDDSYIIQERISGVEFTVDFAVSKEGRFLGCVPRRRLETRAGEVSKGVTVHAPLIEEVVEKLAACLPNAYGVLNAQLFFDESSNEMRFIELNARVGGGYPLSHTAGATFFNSLRMGNRATPIRNWESGLVMLRYDEAVFLKTDSFAMKK